MRSGAYLNASGAKDWKVHVSEAADNGVPQLCFHYDPELISMDRVRSIARQTGASITEKIAHKLIEVEGIRHSRQARSIERNLSDLNGMIEASVSASGMVRVEFDRSQLDEATIIKALQKEGLDIPDTAVNAEKYLRSIKETEKPQKDQKSEKKPEHEEGDVEHEYAHGGLFGKNTELIFSILSGILLTIGFGLSFVDAVSSWVSLSLYIGAYFFGGFYTTKEAFEAVRKGGFEIDFLMLVAAIGAAILGAWAEGAYCCSCSAWVMPSNIMP